jgi:CoA:oxalate CoA-transferase
VSVPAKGLLADVTVVELCQALAGPYCGQMLADLGARVIKIEKPRGDDARGMPPYFVGDTSTYFLSVNRGKESLAIDLKADGAAELVLRLIEQADIVIENNRPGVLERLGLAPATMLARNPGLVVCSITGFGQDGPYRDRGAYDIVVQAASGGMSITGERDGPPVRAGIPVADMSAGLGGAVGVLAALHSARATGVGCHIDLAMLDLQVSMLGYHMVNTMFSGVVPGPSGNGHSGAGGLGAYKCADGIVLLVAPMAESMWPRLCEAIGRPDLPVAADFGTREQRSANRDLLRSELDQTFARRSSAEWMTVLDRAGIPASPINTLDRVAADPQILHRDMVRDADFKGRPVRLVGNPIKVRNGAAAAGVPAPPGLGEHTVSLLAGQLGVSSDDLQRLIDAGVVVDGSKDPADGARLPPGARNESVNS